MPVQGIGRARDAYLFNIEDFDISHVATIPFPAARRGNSETIHQIIVLRNPYNWLASRLKGKYPTDLETIEAWKSQARECLKLTSYLPCSLPIIYDRWFVSADYRHSISQSLRLDCSYWTDEVTGYIPNFGGGSSFDRFNFQNRAQEMDVLGVTPRHVVNGVASGM